MIAVILAGGMGTRLYPITADLPKPLVPIGGRPVIDILLHQFRKAGVTEVWLATNHKADQIRSVVGDGSRYGLAIQYSQETDSLSTVGPLTLIPTLPEHFIVANGDILTDLKVNELFDFHIKNPALLTVATKTLAEKTDYGVITVDTHRKRIVGFEEKPTRMLTVSAGIYVFSREALGHVQIGTRYGFDDLMRDLIAKGKPINNFPHEGFWLDIGRPEDYAAAQLEIERIEGWLR